MDSEISWEDCIADLPPLNALSTSTSSDPPHLQLLDLLSLDHNTPAPPTKPVFDHPLDQAFYPSSLSTPQNLSHCTSTNSQNSTPSSDISATLPNHHTPSSPPSPHPDYNELSTRLSSAVSETTALRKRVAALTAENRTLRQALDHANARLVAVAQAASHPPASSPVVLGLAQLPSNVAHKFSSALTVSDTTDDPRDRKKRKRVSGAAATTMACVMFMWGAFVGTPGLLKSTSPPNRSNANLPAVWTSTDTAVAPPIPRLPDAVTTTWQPECLRSLKQLPTGTEETEDRMDDVKGEPLLSGESGEEEDDKKEQMPNEMFVDVHDEQAANVVATAEHYERQLPDYSYVLCRDAANAVDNVKACAKRMEKGETCGQPHTISLILPASAAGLGKENGTDSLVELAEVQCTITSVARIPYPTTTTTNLQQAKHGKIIAKVPERKREVQEVK